MSTKLKVSKGGQILGDFTRQEIAEGLANGTLLPDDYYWDPENKSAGWQRLSDLPKEPEQPKASSSNPLAIPTPPSAPQAQPPAKAQDAANKKAEDDAAMRLTFGVIIILGGMFIVFLGLVGDPRDSAIRQAVLSQMITNGLLVMIFGLILARK
jgi:hypothetical protein